MARLNSAWTAPPVWTLQRIDYFAFADSQTNAAKDKKSQLESSWPNTHKSDFKND
jgi:hypothetical protein